MILRRSHLLFAVMCAAWGSTWIAAKAGIAVVPPSLFVGTRFIVAGTLMLLYLAARRQLPRFGRVDLVPLLVMTVLMIAATYALLFWGARQVSTGMAAVLDLALLPIALLTLGALLGEDRFTPARLCGTATGLAGLLLLFGPRLRHPGAGHRMELLGAAAIIASALLYSLGSVLARPLLRRHPPAALSGVTMLAGGVTLVCFALLTEAGAAHALRGQWGLAAWSGWVFLVLFGSLAAYTIFLHLVHCWGPAAAGSYAFVSPVVAVVLGVVIYHETVTAQDLAGMATMLAGAWLTLRPLAIPDPTTPPPAQA